MRHHSCPRRHTLSKSTHTNTFKQWKQDFFGGVGGYSVSVLDGFVAKLIHTKKEEKCESARWSVCIQEEVAGGAGGGWMSCRGRMKPAHKASRTGGSWTPRNRAEGFQPVSVQLRTHAHARARTLYALCKHKNTRRRVRSATDTFPSGMQFKSKCASIRRAVHAAGVHARDFAVEMKWSRDSLKFQKGTRDAAHRLCV